MPAGIGDDSIAQVGSAFAAAVSDDGRYIVFHSEAALVPGDPAETQVLSPDRLKPRRIDKQGLELIQKFVSGGALHRPLVPQLLAGGKDLFDEERNLRYRSGAGAGIQRRSQSREVGQRVAQAVDVIYTQGVHAAIGDPFENASMYRIEDLGFLHPEGGEIRHVEEAAVVDLPGGAAPRGQPVMLLREEITEVAAWRR